MKVEKKYLPSDSWDKTEWISAHSIQACGTN